MKTKNNKNASSMVLVLVATGVFFVIFSSAISYGLIKQKFNKMKIASTQAFNVAEAGIDYYRWFLYHYPNNCTTTPSCEVLYDYYSDPSGQISGSSTLTITPPTTASSTFKIKSVGSINTYPNLKRTIEVELKKTSFADYMFISNSNVQFATGTSVTEGDIHSNGGIRFDGVADVNSAVYSALASYDDPSHNDGDPTTTTDEIFDFGVHTHRSPADPPPPANMPDRSADIFRGGRYLSAPRIGFEALGQYIQDISDLASSSAKLSPPSALYLPLAKDYNSGQYPTAVGYHVRFWPNEIRIYIVRSTQNCPSGIPKYNIANETNSILTLKKNDELVDLTTGILFFRDNVWIDSQNSPSFKDRKFTILAFKEPIVGGQEADITINEDVIYSSLENSTLGLIAQNNINIGFDSESDLEIQAAMISKNGRIGREDYSGCSGSNKTKLTITGSMATFSGYGFSQYPQVDLIYDSTLPGDPPPHFPTTGEYRIVSWKEQ